MRYKKLIRIASFVMSGVLLLSGCSGQNGNKASEPLTSKPLYEWGTVKDQTITIWGDEGDLTRPFMARSYERYQELTGNTIETRFLAKTDTDELLPKIFASDSTEKPDILVGYGGTNVESLNPSENFYDFTDAPWMDDLTDTALNQAIFNGEVVGLPFGEVSVSGTLYNKEVFSKLDIKIPATQEEFMQVCETMLKNGITPMYLPYTEITMLLYQFPLDSILKDREILNGLNDGSLSYADIPEMKTIVEWYKTMSDKGYFGENYLENNWNGMDAAMQDGKYGMMLCWDTWLYTGFTGDPSKIGLMPAFIGIPENGCFEGANIILHLVNKNSPRLEASLDLITFLSDPYNYNVAYAGIYTAPMFNRQSGNITTPQYMEAERLIDKLFYDSTAWPRVRGFSQIDATYIQKYMQNEYTVEECLNEMNNARLKRAGMDIPH